MLASTVSSKILLSIAEIEGFNFAVSFMRSYGDMIYKNYKIAR